MPLKFHDNSIDRVDVYNHVRDFDAELTRNQQLMHAVTACCSVIVQLLKVLLLLLLKMTMTMVTLVNAAWH